MFFYVTVTVLCDMWHMCDIMLTPNSKFKNKKIQKNKIKKEIKFIIINSNTMGIRVEFNILKCIGLKVNLQDL